MKIKLNKLTQLNLANETVSKKEQQHITGGRRYVTDDPITFQQKMYRSLR